MATKKKDQAPEKSKGELLKESLCMTKKYSYDIMTEEQVKECYDYCEGYKEFLDKAKTERESVTYAVEYLERNGFKPFEYGKKYKKGDKFYLNNRGKAIYIVVVGKKSFEEGVHIAAAHVDTSRIDLKQNPLYEDNNLAFFKTHYYGGIKKYQWVTLPLALHGVVMKADGTKVEVCIGEDESDPIFYITDLLPHLGKDQAGKPLYNAFSGEDLNILCGSRPFDDEKVGEKIKLNVLALLNEKYGIVEEDFLSSELTLVPASKARDVGFDRSLIGAYGHDDRVCAYPILTAIADVAGKNEHTSVTIFADKEETGSDTNTGMTSFAFEDMLKEMCINAGQNPRKMFANSVCLSADVNAGFDPNFAGVYEARNSAFLNKGVCVTKFTGGGGKGSTNDAHAEFVSYVRNLFNDAGVIWQMGELGKVDQGGGGTVAKILAKLNIDVIDVGVPVLSMHAPVEVVAKTDIWSSYNAFVAFFKD